MPGARWSDGEEEWWVKCLKEFPFQTVKVAQQRIYLGHSLYSYRWLQYVLYYVTFQFSSVQWLSRVQLSATPWTAARQASLSITNPQGLLKLMSIESAMPSNLNTRKLLAKTTTIL